MSERENQHNIDLQREFNEHYNNREIEDDELIILNSEGWRVVGYAFNLRGNNRFCNQYTLENVNSGERIIMNRNIQHDTLDAAGYVYRELQRTKPKIPLMDSKYPHVCFECKNPIQYKHAFIQGCNKFGISNVNLGNHNYHKEVCLEKAQKCYTFEKQFRKWWKDKRIQFLCCVCYAKANNPNKQYDLDHISLSVDRYGVHRFGIGFRDELDNNNWRDPE